MPHEELLLLLLLFLLLLEEPLAGGGNEVVHDLLAEDLALFDGATIAGAASTTFTVATIGLLLQRSADQLPSLLLWLTSHAHGLEPWLAEDKESKLLDGTEDSRACEAAGWSTVLNAPGFDGNTIDFLLTQESSWHGPEGGTTTTLVRNLVCIGRRHETRHGELKLNDISHARLGMRSADIPLEDFGELVLVAGIWYWDVVLKSISRSLGR